MIFSCLRVNLHDYYFYAHNVKGDTEKNSIAGKAMQFPSIPGNGDKLPVSTRQGVGICSGWLFTDELLE